MGLGPCHPPSLPVSPVPLVRSRPLPPSGTRPPTSSAVTFVHGRTCFAGRARAAPGMPTWLPLLVSLRLRQQASPHALTALPDPRVGLPAVLYRERQALQCPDHAGVRPEVDIELLARRPLLLSVLRLGPALSLRQMVHSQSLASPCSPRPRQLVPPPTSAGCQRVVWRRQQPRDGSWASARHSRRTAVEGTSHLLPLASRSRPLALTAFRVTHPVFALLCGGYCPG